LNQRGKKGGKKKADAPRLNSPIRRTFYDRDGLEPSLFFWLENRLPPAAD